LYADVPECPIMILVYKSERAVDDVEAHLSERLGVRLRRVPWR